MAVFSKRDPAELLELREAALNQVTLGVELLVEGVFSRTGGVVGVVGDDGHGTLFGDRLAQGIGVVGGVGHDDLGGQAVNRAIGLWAVAALTGGQGEAHRAAEAPHGQVDLGAQATAGASDGRIFSPPFWPRRRADGRG